MRLGTTLRFAAPLCLLVMPLVYPGTASAQTRNKAYLTDGTKATNDALAPYANPNDGICVVGVALDGTLQVDTSIKNYRDCVAYTSGLTGMTTSAACTVAAGAGNDGYRHTWATSNTCVNAADPRIAIPLPDLDRTLAMCLSKGGTTLTSPGTCVAYGWQYMNRTAFENTSVAYRDSVLSPVGYEGRTDADNLGFCYASIRIGSHLSTPYTIVTCPSQNNLAFACASGANQSKTCTLATEVTDCGGAGVCQANAGWTMGTQGTPQQGFASYDAGLGWSWDNTNGCLYAYGRKGYANAALTRVNGTVFTAANSYVDLTTLTTQGDCLANGGSWDNWLSSNGWAAPGATIVTESTVVPDPTKLSDRAKLDSTTPLASGGGQFYSGTGSVCTRCHTDQSRSTAERNKPGFGETAHKLVGDTNPAWNPSSDWGLKGVQCEICHATGKPSRQDVGLIVQPYPQQCVSGTKLGQACNTDADCTGVVNGTCGLGGQPRAAAGHNNTEYGSHVTGVCIYCHGTKTVPDTGNPAAVIQVTGGDFAPTGKGLPPIANQFLNSPHARYAGDSKTVNVTTKTNYGSTFVGYICRSSNSIGGGSILTTVYRNGVVEKIPNLDSPVNPACTNPGDGSATSGAGGFWVPEGEAAITSNGITAVSSDKGNCMTCHDVHWSKKSTNPEAEPIRRECTTCHSHAPGDASVTSAPQIDLATINHLHGPGTPLEHAATNPNEACETCHMPKSSPTGSPMHLWRINTSAGYTTMGTTQANTYADGTYPTAVGVDVAHACGQCHTSGPGPNYTTAQLAAVAAGMHNPAGVSYPTTFTYTTSGLTVNVTAQVNCSGPCPVLTYDWTWNDATPNGSGSPTSHIYTSGGSKTITLVTKLNGNQVGSQTRSLTLTATDAPPVASATCTWNANTWVMSVVDHSTDDHAIQTVAVNWGDGSVQSFGAQNGSFSHSYLNPGASNVTVRVIDNALQATTYSCPVQATPAYFSLSGTVKNRLGTKGLRGAKIQLKAGSLVIRAIRSQLGGVFLLDSLKPGTYTLNVSKLNYTFAVPATQVTLGPSPAPIVINAVAP